METTRTAISLVVQVMVVASGGWMTIAEVAEHSRLSIHTIRRLIRRGKIPASRPSPRRIIIATGDLEDYLRSCRVAGRNVDMSRRVPIRDILRELGC